MRQKSLNQTELARVIAVNPAAISNYLSGARVPQEDVLSRLAIYFQVAIGDLFGDSEPVAGSLLADKVEEDVDSYLTRSTIAKTEALRGIDSLMRKAEERHKDFLNDLNQIKKDLMR